jgi:hypothetical protein
VGSRRVRLAAAMAAILAGVAVQVWCHRAIDQEQAEPDETERAYLMAGPSGEVRFARVTSDGVEVTGSDPNR